MINPLAWVRHHNDDILWALAGVVVGLQIIRFVLWAIKYQIGRIRCPHCYSKWTDGE